MKEVTSGAHYTTVEVDTAEAVKFSFPSTSLSVEASGGNITVALTDTAQAGDDETITVPDGESRMFIHHRMNIDTYYLTGSGTAKLYASNMGDVNPFNGKSKGGDGGGDTTHYKGTTTTPLENGSTTNPIVIDGESYTAVFGDVVVYGYTEFVFDGTAWSEFGRPFDTVPTLGSTNAVTSDGIYNVTPLMRSGGTGAAMSGCTTGKGSFAIGNGSKATAINSTATGYYTTANANQAYAEGYYTTASKGQAHASGYYTTASGYNSYAGGSYTIANKDNSTAIGQYNKADTDVAHLLIVGNGAENARSNILEVSKTEMNVNGDIKINNVAIPTPYTAMPAITEDMLGKVVQYVGATDANYTKGWFYIASSNGAAEPTYYWQPVDKPAYTLTTLWEYDGVDHIDKVGTVICSEAELAEYDFVGMLYGFRNTENGSIVGQYSFAPITDIPTNLSSVAMFSTGPSSIYSGRIGIQDGNLKITAVSNATYTDSGVTFRMGIYKVVAVKFGVSDAALPHCGRTETVLWENEGTTNPETITLSEAWSDFDELVIVTVGAGSVAAQYETAKHTSVMAIGSAYTMWYNNETTWGTYTATSSTVFTKISAGGDYHIAKIIGIKY